MKNSDILAPVEATLVDWSIVRYPQIYNCKDTPEAFFAKLNCGLPIALLGRAKNDPRYNAEIGDFADGHRLLTGPLTEIKDGKFYTQDSIYTLTESDKNTAYKNWCEERQHTVPPDGVWSAEDEQNKLVLRHICETCGREELLTSEDGFQQGWDYPPKMGTFKVVSPRTCGSCGIETTLWFEMTLSRTPIGQLSERHKQTLAHILAEPENILPESNQSGKEAEYGY